MQKQWWGSDESKLQDRVGPDVTGQIQRVRRAESHLE